MGLVFVGQRGTRHGCFSVQGHDGVDLRVARIDTRQVGRHDVTRAGLAGDDLGTQRDGTQVTER